MQHFENWRKSNCLILTFVYCARDWDLSLTELLTLLMLFFDFPPVAPGTLCFPSPPVCLHTFVLLLLLLSGDSSTPRGVSHQLCWALAPGVHNSLGFEGFTGCCSDWDEYCVSVQCTASNVTHPYSLCIGQNFSLHASFSACCSNFTKSILIY